MTLEQIGWSGNALLAICGLFEAISTYRKGRCDLNPIFLITWTLGEIFGVIYAYAQHQDPILIFNYGFNLTSCIFMCYYKFRRNNGNS
tara:strand:- start:1886 stop:2149 length:264 start_codon:yes stop_codon:yes gene_type:complete